MANFIEVKVEGINAVVARLNGIPVNKFLRDLMRGAEAMVDMYYQMQADAGNKDYTSKVTTGKYSSTLTVSGADVGFLEFGAGVLTSWDDFATQVPYSVAPGSYSIWAGSTMGQFARTGLNFWYYANAKYTGITPTFGMQSALEFVRTEVYDYVINRISQYITDGK